MAQTILAGIDIGSVSVKVALADREGRLLYEVYQRHFGKALPVAEKALEKARNTVAQKQGGHALELAVTGAGGHAFAEKHGAFFINEIVALSRGLARFTPECRTAIEMGGQDSKLLLFEPDEAGRPSLKDFSMNSLCAAGTGSFLDQQATRLNLSIEEDFANCALGCKNPPHIAGRCSVFAKSDMIHLQQVATPVEDIAAGLCHALARSFKSTVGRGKSFENPLCFLGGVASNRAMVRAFEAILKLEPGSLLVPPHHNTLGAYGAALSLLENRGPERVKAKPSRLKEKNEAPPQKLRPFLTPEGLPDMSLRSLPPGEEKIPAYIGVDVGSVSTNVLAIDTEGRLLAKRYLWTAGRPIEAVRQGLEEIYEEIGGRIQVQGAGATGSGRYLIGHLIGADVIRNEITAQATAAIFIDPTVDTIFEIGGQDSKYIALDHGTVCDFEMNKACAAGTGSFLAEQAERLKVDLKTEFSDFALDAPQPVSLGDRCTVFMESDLMDHQQQGAETANLLGGLAYSIVHNYLNRVVADHRIGRRIFFQGGTAYNKAVVAAFSAVLGRPIIVPPHHDVTGAIGAALLARQAQPEATAFRGFALDSLNYQLRSFVCHSCDNLCEIRQLEMEGEPPYFHGSRCEKFDVDRQEKEPDNQPDCFAERWEALLAHGAPGQEKHRGRVGIPLALSFHEFLPFWQRFFESLGFQVVLSPKTRSTLVHQGVEAVVNETCFPVKVAHGHIAHLLEAEVDFLFLPCLIDSATPEFGPEDRSAFNCPLVQTLPFTAKGALDFSKRPVFRPALHPQWGLEKMANALMEREGRQFLKASKKEIRHALQEGAAAQNAFREQLQMGGKAFLDSLGPDEKALVIVSRPYNGCDPGLNLDLPKKLRNLGVPSIPMDMLPLDETALPEKWNRIYWRYGQHILKAAEIVRQDPRLFAVYITNFSCGPDSFLLEYFRQVMSPKPHLLLEIDEHGADAGLITRCEAFLDTLENLDRNGGARTVPAKPFKQRHFTNHRRIYLPNMCPQAEPLAAAFRSVGVPAEVMPLSNSESVELGRRFTSGRECYPCLLTTGDIARQTRHPDFKPEEAAFFMASADGPCRLGQYHQLQRQVLDRLGFEETPILALEQGEDYRNTLGNLGRDFEMRAWTGIIAVDGLMRLRLQKRPQERESGAVDGWFQEALAALCQCLEKGGKGLTQVLENQAGLWKAIPARQEKLPLIGIVGEVYVRNNVFANDYLVERLEALGVEVATPGMGEWIRYTRLVRAKRHQTFHRYRGMVLERLTEAFMARVERRVFRALGLPPEPSPGHLMEQARPYINPAFEGETVLTVGKAVDLIRHGARGLVNTMPFTCMPGAICTALLKQVKDDYDDLPLLNLSYTGQREGNASARLEAFVYQARQYQPGSNSQQKTPH